MKKRMARRVWTLLTALVPDILAIAGIALIARGIWRVYPPAGLVALGVLLIAAAFAWRGGGGDGL